MSLLTRAVCNIGQTAKSTMLDEETLKSFRCLETGSRLKNLESALLERINVAIRNHEISDASGHKIAKPLDGGLVNQERTVVYAVYNRIPKLVAESSIRLEQLSNKAENLNE